MNILKCKNVTKVYKVKQAGDSFKGLIEGIFSPKYEQVISVNNIDIELTNGTCLGVLGTNGSGKSTLTKMLTGLLEPTSGDIQVLGHKPAKRSRDFLKNIGVVFGHKSSLWWDLPLIESFKSQKLIYGISQNDFDMNLEKTCEAFDLKKILNRPVKYLSLGERVKAEISANLLHSPKVLFLDEPTVGLDVVSKFELRKFIKSWVKQSSTVVVLTTHDMVDVEECCNRVVLLENGSNMYDGDFKQLKDKLIKYKILDLKSNDRPLVKDEIESIFLEIKKIDELAQSIDLTPELISVKIDKSLSLKNIFEKIEHSIDLDINLRLPTLEESLRDFYLNENGVSL